MAKKTKAEKKVSASGLFDSALAGTVKESAQQIWLAGLGAFSKAQQEGGKVFEALVKDGVSLQRKTQEAASAKLGEVGARVTGAAEEATGKAGQQWDKLESIFEQRVTKAMGHLGVPSQQDFEALLARVDALSDEVRVIQVPQADALSIGLYLSRLTLTPATIDWLSQHVRAMVDDGTLRRLLSRQHGKRLTERFYAPTKSP